MYGDTKYTNSKAMLKILDENKLAKLKSETKTCAKQRKKLTGWYGARTGGVICKKKKITSKNRLVTKYIRNIKHLMTIKQII